MGNTGSPNLSALAAKSQISVRARLAGRAETPGLLALRRSLRERHQEEPGLTTPTMTSTTKKVVVVLVVAVVVVVSS